MTKKIKDFKVSEIVEYCDKRFRNWESCYHCPFENCCACQFKEKLENEVKIEND